ncbi:AraC family transcriptional regulator [Kitasatospora kifunensis]|uniref:AraC-like DNA-binding protein n=1 Tax=Kitasatospora kifunensis TaxID=58351 RepID=A0A7W7R964_KITKI|nr:AraC family transcriptional regulator [Kitasatospora kifunensis]MBB4927619.1 AraC-like DNA-binding protein [Kitasatospora kifunensis]
MFESSDVSEMHALVSRHFTTHRLRILTDRSVNGRSRFRSLHQGTVAMYEIGYGTAVEVEPGELPDFYVQIPLAGSGTVAINGRQLGSPLSMAGPGHRLSMAWSADTLAWVVLIRQEAMERALTTRLGEVPSGPPRFEPVLSDAGSTGAWLRGISGFAGWAEAGLLDRSPLGRGHFEQVLVHGLLDAQPHSLSEALADRGVGILPSALRRATTYCAEHAHEPISVADMAQAARVSQQSLRAGFRTHLRTTPLTYLRRVRLDLAHRDLLAIADGRGIGTVTDVALRWGFTHLGRFAQTYRHCYGVTPSQTLRRAGSR